MREERFPTPGPITLEVKLGTVEIELQSIDTGETVVTLQGPDDKISAIEFHHEDDLLTITTPRKSLLDFVSVHVGGLISATPVSMHVSLPTGSNVSVSGQACDVALDGEFGELSTHSVSGDVEATGLINGDVKVNTVSGDVRLDEVLGSVKIDSISGDLQARSLAQSLSVNSISGGVRVDSLREGSVKIDTVSGDVALGVASGSRLDVDAHTASGVTRSEIPLDATADDDQSRPKLVVRGSSVSGDFKIARAA